MQAQAFWQYSEVVEQVIVEVVGLVGLFQAVEVGTSQNHSFSQQYNDTNEFDGDIDDNIDGKREEKWVENSATGALAVTRDHPYDI